eukprot:g62060.t1
MLVCSRAKPATSQPTSRAPRLIMNLLRSSVYMQAFRIPIAGILQKTGYNLADTHEWQQLGPTDAITNDAPLRISRQYQRPEEEEVVSRDGVVFMLFFIFHLSLLAGAQITCQIIAQRGCYADNVDKRFFPFGNTYTHQLTQETCAAWCSQFSVFAYSAVEGGEECYCGTQAQLATATSLPLASCQQVACPGNNNQWCGGVTSALVFQATCKGQQLPNFQGCVTKEALALPYCDPSLPVGSRVAALLSHFATADLIYSISPNVSLGDPCDCFTDGLPTVGLSEYLWLDETNSCVAAQCIAPDKCASTWPSSLGLAASFNRTAWNLRGQAIGRELRAFRNLGWHRNPDLARIGLTGYGPNINTVRDPRFGRNSELASEDPFLSGSFAVAYVRGLQTEDGAGHPLMLAYLKHFVAYSTEDNRGFATYNISLQDFWETYLPQYEMGFVQGRATGAMCSYNGENGRPSCANDYILKQVVRSKWRRPDAHISTDCGAVNNMLGPPAHAPDYKTAAAWSINNGTDLEMGTDIWRQPDGLALALKEGLVNEKTIYNAAFRAFFHQFKAGRFDPLSSSPWNGLGLADINSSYTQQVVREAEAQSYVLLRNEGKLLPLPLGQALRIAVVGPMGVTQGGLLQSYAGDQPCYYGTDHTACVISIYQAIKNLNEDASFGRPGSTVAAQGVDFNSTDASDIQPALQLADQADVLLLVLGTNTSGTNCQECEGHDRDNTDLPGLQEQFALQVLGLGRPTVLIICNGGMVSIDKLVGPATAIVEAFHPAFGAPTLAATLFGLPGHNRWGKLPATIYPSSFQYENPMDNYHMSKPPGRTYKYYTGQALWPFGFGLSYTSFSLECEQLQAPAVFSSFSPTTAANNFPFLCHVANTGKREGDEVVMVFHAVSDQIRQQADHPIAIKTLVGFERTSLASGKTASLAFDFTTTTFEVVNTKGVKVLYPGTHYLIFSRGVGQDVIFPVEFSLESASSSSAS